MAQKDRSHAYFARSRVKRGPLTGMIRHRTGSKLVPNLAYWNDAYQAATGDREGKVVGVWPEYDRRGSLSIYVRVQRPNGWDTWSPYFEQNPDPADVAAMQNDPAGWIVMMEGATEWEHWEWFQL